MKRNEVLSTKELQDIVARQRSIIAEHHALQDKLLSHAISCSAETFSKAIQTLAYIADNTKSSSIRKKCLAVLDLNSMRATDAILKKEEERNKEIFSLAIDAVIKVLDDKIETAKSLNALPAVYIGESYKDAILELKK